MFVTELEKRHFENAKHAGSIILFEIKFRSREPEETFNKKHQYDIVKRTGEKVFTLTFHANEN